MTHRFLHAGFTPQSRPEVTAEFIIVGFIHIRSTSSRFAVTNRGKEPTYATINTVFLLIVLIKDEMGEPSRITLDHHSHDSNSLGELRYPTSKAGCFEGPTIPHPYLRVELVVLVPTSAPMGGDVKDEAIPRLKL